jgi:hypothetical protein
VVLTSAWSYMNVIAEYAVPAVVVAVHTTASVGEWEEPMVLDRFKEHAEQYKDMPELV